MTVTISFPTAWRKPQRKSWLQDRRFRVVAPLGPPRVRPKGVLVEPISLSQYLELAERVAQKRRVTAKKSISTGKTMGKTIQSNQPAVRAPREIAAPVRTPVGSDSGAASIASTAETGSGSSYHQAATRGRLAAPTVNPAQGVQSQTLAVFRTNRRTNRCQCPTAHCPAPPKRRPGPPLSSGLITLPATRQYAGAQRTAGQPFGRTVESWRFRTRSVTPDRTNPINASGIGSYRRICPKLKPPKPTGIPGLV